jgi:hypothetical protein
MLALLRLPRGHTMAGAMRILVRTFDACSQSRLGYMRLPEQ